MQVGNDCTWFLLKMRQESQDEFAVQYTGSDPDTIFPVDIQGPFNISSPG